MAEERLSFQAEVARLLDIVVHSLYSQKEIFLRELISNASDACDKLRYAALTEPGLIAGDADLRITIRVDKDARTLTIADNGIGMNRDDLIANLGTIAKSGTGEFLKTLSGDARKDVSLIGQFGVGFYSAFMVADTVSVLTRKAGEGHGWLWTSDGRGEFTIEEAADAPRGARITLHLKDDCGEYLDDWRLKQIVKTYSDHIALPVLLEGATKDKAEEGEEAEAAGPETLNTASALWTRAKSEISEEQYKEFYHHVAHAFDDPWLTVHYKAEGAVEYTGLLFVPSTPPLDLFQPERKGHVKLYVNRVFITDDCEGLMPRWLRFARGVVDSPDLPLNVSREMLQNQPLLKKMQSGLAKRLLAELKTKAKDDAAGYATFWGNFGAVLKEGLYEDFERREDLLSLARFRSTASDDLVSFDTYVGRMKDGQSAIYYATGDDAAALKANPQLEGFLAKGVEVLLLTDPIDEFWPMAVTSAAGKPLKAVGGAAADLDAIKGDEAAEADKKKDEAPADQIDALIASFKAALGEAVQDVRTTGRLTSSPCCLVPADGAMSLHLERLLRAHQGNGPKDAGARVLEINPAHALVKRLAEKAKADPAAADLAEYAALFLDQARIVEGEHPTDAAAFARRLSLVMERGL